MNIKVGVVINKERLSNKKEIFVAHCNDLNVTSQGKTFEEVVANIKEAIDIEIEECPEKLERFFLESEPVFTTVEITRDVQASGIIGKTTG